MTDSANQATGEAEASSRSALGERLIRRGTEPLGVIDVRHAEEKYFRIVRWLARHTALLDHLRSRYGVEESPANAERLFAMQRPLRREVNVFSTSIQSFSPAFEPQASTSDAPRHPLLEIGRPSSLAQIIAERSVGPVSDHAASPEGEFRISRRPPPMLRLSDAAPHSSPRDASVSELEQPGRGATVETDSSAHRAPDAFVFRSSGVDRTVETADMTTGANTQEKLPNTSAGNEQTGTASSIVQREESGSSSAREQQPTVSNEQTGTASSAVQREESGSPSAREQQPSTPARNDQTGTASSVVLREVSGSSNTQEPSVSTLVRNERVDTDSSFVQRKTATNTIAQERPASVSDQVKISSILQREAVRDTSAQGPTANLEPGTRNQEPETLNAQPRTLLRTAVRNEPNRSASSIVQPVDREIATALPLSPLPVIRPLSESPGGRTLLTAQSAGAAAPPEYGDAGMQQNARGLQTSEFVPGAIAAPEIRGDSISQKAPPIVWREPQAGPRAADFTARESLSGSELSRRDQTGPADFFTATQQSGQDGPVARTHNQSREIELEHISPQVIRSISERVVRAITLDLKVEHERRGVTKWR